VNNYTDILHIEILLDASMYCGKFVAAYNNTVHVTTGVAPAKVNDSNILEIWKKINGDNIK
jgi:hypothetical protein